MPTKPGLTDTAIRQTKPEPRSYNLYDTLGLYLTVAPTGAKWWRLKYRFAGRERRIGLGAYPQVCSKRHESDVTMPALSFETIGIPGRNGAQLGTVLK